MAEDITTVILSSRIWVEELTAELVRENFPADMAEQRARHVLHRIVGHAGYRSRFLVAADEPPAPEQIRDNKADGRREPSTWHSGLRVRGEP